MSAKRFCLALGLAAVGCGGGGGSPTSATLPPAPTPLQVSVFDGWTGQPVTAAISPQSPLPGATLTAVAGGYLPRVQTAASQLYLWPAEDEYVRALVYSEFSNKLLNKWPDGFTIGLDAALFDDEDVHAVADETAAEVSRVTGLRVVVGRTGAVTVTLDPDDGHILANEALAYTTVSSQANRIVSSRIVFGERKYIMGAGGAVVKRNTLLHELGHAIGLGHSLSSDDVMCPSWPRRNERTYSPGEEVSLRLMYRYRAPGNAAPDREAGIAAAAGAQTVVIVD